MALVTVVAFVCSVAPETVFAMGANGGTVNPQGEPKGIGGGKEGDGKRSGQKEEEPAGTKEKENGSSATSPKKKPRLKFWDPYECGC